MNKIKYNAVIYESDDIDIIEALNNIRKQNNPPACLDVIFSTNSKHKYETLMPHLDKFPCPWVLRSVVNEEKNSLHDALKLALLNCRYHIIMLYLKDYPLSSDWFERIDIMAENGDESQIIRTPNYECVVISKIGIKVLYLESDDIIKHLQEKEHECQVTELK